MNHLRALALGIAAALVPACSGNNTSNGSGSSGSSDQGASGSTAASGSNNGSSGAQTSASGSNAGGGSGSASTGSAGSGVSESGAASGTPTSESGAAASGAAGSGASASGAAASGSASTSSGASSGSAADAGPTSVILEDISGKGEVVADSKGLALYVYKPDTPGAGTAAPKSTCTGGCLTAWPVFYASPLTVPANGIGLNASDFGSFDRGAGVMQSTYMGWPLYYYKDDTKAGDVKGDGEGGVWYALKIPFTAP